LTGGITSQVNKMVLRSSQCRWRS